MSASSNSLGGDTDEENKEETEGGAGKPAPIKFKRKKKKLKGLASSYFSAYKDLTYKSRFEEWTKNELTDLLIHTGIELRNEVLLSHRECIDLVDAVRDCLNAGVLAPHVLLPVFSL